MIADCHVSGLTIKEMVNAYNKNPLFSNNVYVHTLDDIIVEYLVYKKMNKWIIEKILLGRLQLGAFI